MKSSFYKYHIVPVYTGCTWIEVGTDPDGWNSPGIGAQNTERRKSLAQGSAWLYRLLQNDKIQADPADLVVFHRRMLIHYPAFRHRFCDLLNR